MRQLPLQLSVKLLYSPANFYVHAGVRELIEELQARVATCSYSMSWVVGPKRSGKSHLAIKLMEEIYKLGLLPRVLTGQEFDDNLSVLASSKSYVYLVDDAESYFSKIARGDSGPFVAFAERCRSGGAHLVMLSSSQLSELPCDEHVMSRIVAGSGFSIGAPDENEVEELVFAMAKQRGLNLTEVKRQYVTKRIRRDVASIDEFLERLFLSGTVGSRLSSFQTLHDSL